MFKNVFLLNYERKVEVDGKKKNDKRRAEKSNRKNKEKKKRKTDREKRQTTIIMRQLETRYNNVRYDTITRFKFDIIKI